MLALLMEVFLMCKIIAVPVGKAQRNLGSSLGSPTAPIFFKILNRRDRPELFSESSLKVHKHENFFILFLQKPKPYGPKGL
jgi:hypothetical protein